MFKIGINFDEISDDIDVSLATMVQESVKYGEIRTVHGKNFVDFTGEELTTIKQKVMENGIDFIAAASPLFKWYKTRDSAEVLHDNFGFNPRLNETEKKEYVRKAIRAASILGIGKIRIFSNLDDGSLSVNDFIHDPILSFALSEAQKANVVLLIENEPVCIVRTKKNLLAVFDAIRHPNLGLWLDIANLIEIGESVDEKFIRSLADKIEYLHVKDFTIQEQTRVYCPLGAGSIDYAAILGLLNKYLGNKDTCITVETHVPTDKQNASITSIRHLRQLMKGITNDNTTR